MSIVRFLIAWPNAPFTIALGIAAIFALLQISGVLGLIAGGHGDHDHDMDHGMDHGGDHGGDHAGVGDAIFGAFGVGKIPFALIWQTWAIVFAVTGLALNARWLGTDGPPPITLLWTLPSGLLLGAGAVAVIARLLGPVFATKPHEATSRRELVGLSGVVISSQVTDDFGEVRVRDKSGLDLRVICRLAPGSAPPKEHERVVVVDYEEASDALLVAPLEGEGVEGSEEKRVS
ncbi:MAG: DUF1449 family protein [Deltaproteobacteria bacterium]|nr:DUF1449 family protein [Deltaproteobacteria bacterium]